MKNQKTEDLKTEKQIELKTENTALTTTQLPIVPASTNAADVAALATSHSTRLGLGARNADLAEIF